MDTRHPNLAEGRIVLVKKFGEAFLQKTDRLTREVLQ
jgi:protein-tyrosine phosphatase